MDRKVSVFLPCRAGSERVPNKNTKIFAGNEGGLLRIKLSQLIHSKKVDRIVLSSNDTKVFEISEKLDSDKIIHDHRPDYLASSSTSTDDLIKYVPEIIMNDHILWTHVTSPFIDSHVYDMAIEAYFEKLGSSNNDSLMSVNKLQTFLWVKGKPYNYNREIEKWPRTQTIEPIYEVNSGFFISSRQNYLEYHDRIGINPFLYELDHKTSFDIDWPDDFELAEIIFKRNNDY